MDDGVLYQPQPSTPAFEVPQVSRSSVQPGSKCCQNDLSSSPKQSKELTLHQRLGPSADLPAPRPLQGSLVAWITEQLPSCMSHPHSSIHPHSPPCLHLPCSHPHCSPSPHGYPHHSPLPSCGPCHFSPLPHGPHYHSPSSCRPCYHSSSPC